ncbi:LytR/AlgR family response regulator transcription factor [Lachnotalea glycerini]|uniref:LytR/AlgR family response regulator transcription factor n=1 Tax=Lachnotalea glycerini TaxID=1763509 RepID=UPI0011C03D9D|nr:LytTR family DNA-binding domain-containing protein [Lachnotalea glycerini]
MLYIAICDDEIEQSDKIKRIVEGVLKEYSIIYKIQSYKCKEELLTTLEIFDIVFLDIYIGEFNGIETGIKLYQKNRKVKIIYITNYEEFCNEAINHVHAFAYIIKPVEKEKLAKQVKELIKVIGAEKGGDIEIELLDVTEINNKVKPEYPVLRIPVSDILYFEYIKTRRKIRVKTKKNKEYEYNGTIAKTEQKMKPYGFVTCYRGIIVNCAYIIKIKNGTVYLGNGERLPLAQKRVLELKEKFKINIL